MNLSNLIATKEMPHVFQYKRRLVVGTRLKDTRMVQPHAEKSKRDRLQSPATNDVAHPIDTDKLSAALTAALRILRNDPTITVAVTRPAEGAQ